MPSSAPTPHTTIDFWRMTWQERSQTIVMLTSVEERRKKKCHQYWPDTGTKSFGPLKVTMTGQQIFADYTICTLSLQVSDLKNASLFYDLCL